MDYTDLTLLILFVVLARLYAPSCVATKHSSKGSSWLAVVIDWLADALLWWIPEGKNEDRGGEK